MSSMTRDEAQQTFVRVVRNLVQYWDKINENYPCDPPKTCREKLEGLAFSILATLDGVDCQLELAVVEQALNGPEMLHDMFYKMSTPNDTDEAIKALLEAGLIEDSGERREGQPVWRLSKEGEDKGYASSVLQALQDMEELGEDDPQ